VLVVVEDGDVEQLFELLLDDEAVRRLDVLEVDAAEGGAQIAHAIDDGIDIRAVDQDVDGIDVGKTLEQRALALHHGLGRLRAEVAEAEDRRAVGDDGHHVALVGVVVGELGIAGDGEHRHRHARRIGERQIALRRQRLGRRDLELAGLALAVELQRLLLGEVRGGELDGHGWYDFPRSGVAAAITIGPATGRHNWCERGSVATRASTHALMDERRFGTPAGERLRSKAPSSAPSGHLLPKGRRAACGALVLNIGPALRSPLPIGERT
jgi:hypothetical protein